MIDDEMGTHLAYPLPGLGSGGGADDAEVGETSGQLGQDGTNAPAGADDEDGLSAMADAGARRQALDLKPVEQELPGGDRGQGQGGGFGMAQAGGLMTHDAFVHQLQFGVTARPVTCPGIPDLIAGLEKADLGPHGAHHARGVPTQYPELAGRWCQASADLGIHGVNGDGADFDEQVSRPWSGFGQFDIQQGFRIIDGQDLLVTDSFHG